MVWPWRSPRAGDRGAGAADKSPGGRRTVHSGGGFFIAREKGYFKKLGIEIETVNFIDGALAVPSMVSGELEFDGHDGRRQPVQQRRQGRAAGGHPRSRPTIVRASATR